MDQMTPAQRLEYYANNPWAFLTDCCYTKNQVSSGDSIQKFPSQWEYLRLYAGMWERCPLIAVPKSRRMTMSWTNVCLYLHAAMFKSDQDFAFVSKKEDDAAELVKRAEFVYDNIPQDKIPRELLPKKKTYAKPPALIFPEIGSKIQGFPMGADQLRQFTFSGILGDECAFWDDAQAFYSAAFPTIEGGGRMTLISSRSPGFFQRLVYDQLDNQDPIDENHTPTKRYPFNDDSVIVWKNPKNKFTVIDVHYTANPNKKDPVFRATIKASIPIKDYQREYERSWATFEGRPVFEDYSPPYHETVKENFPHLGLPLLIGWDFGLTPAAVVCQLQGPRLIILKEYVESHMGIQKFCPLVMNDLKLKYPQWRDQKKDFQHFIDPAGLAAAQTDERTCAGIMAQCGLKNIFPGPIDFETRRKAVEHFLMLHTREGSGLQVNPKDCPTLCKGFAGGYTYPERYDQVEPSKIRPLKDHFSHCFPAGTMVSTPQGDRPIEALALGDMVSAPGGTFKVSATMNRDADELLYIETSSGAKLSCTSDHPIWSHNSFVRADGLRYLDKLCLKPNTPYKRLMALSFISSLTGILRPNIKLAAHICIGMFGQNYAAKFQKICRFTTSTATRLTTTSTILSLCQSLHTQAITASSGLRAIRPHPFVKWTWFANMPRFGMARLPAANGTASTLCAWPQAFPLIITNVCNAVPNIRLNAAGASADFVDKAANNKRAENLASITKKETVEYAQSLLKLTNTLKQDSVKRIERLAQRTRVYDLTIDVAHCFYANGILVSNCHDALQYVAAGAYTLKSSKPSVSIPTPYYNFGEAEPQVATSDEYKMTKDSFGRNRV